MSIETELYATLTTDPAVSALVGSRVYPGLAEPGATLPYIGYQVVVGERLSTITGIGDAKRKRIQISCYGSTYASAEEVAVAVEAALEGDGYHTLEYDFYDEDTQIYTRAVDWSFMA